MKLQHRQPGQKDEHERDGGDGDRRTHISGYCKVDSSLIYIYIHSFTTPTIHYPLLTINRFSPDFTFLTISLLLLNHSG
jgi:hypothetical protein